MRKDRKDYPINQPYGEEGVILLEEIINPLSSKNRKGKFKCVCGKIFTARISEIISGATKACGCKRDHQKIHGLRNHPMYNTYILVMGRCYNTRNKLYPYYGDRGIIMSDEFKGNPVNFIAYISSLPDYDKRLNYTEYDFSLDRIENNKMYERGNLRWATRSEQMLNRRRFNQYDGRRLEEPTITRASNLVILNNVR